MTPIKERPILFSAPMVRAILGAQKTVTRRVVKSDWSQSARPPLETSSGIFHFWCSGEHSCPYGRPGDRLWIRETLFINDFRDGDVPESERADCEVFYRADGLPDLEGEEELIRWRPSIHMPRWASRILLEITAVRVERLQDISQADAIAEGVLSCERDLDPDGNDYSPYELFSALWVSINGHDNWAANPWVWVVEFKQVEVANV